MRIKGGVQLNESSLKTAIKAMQVQTALMANVSENVTGFDKVGYQRKESVISSFTEYLGVDGLSTVVDDTVGRLTTTDNALDLAIATKGYFQVQTPDGIKITRDGRFKIDVNGNFLDLENNKVLSNTGVPIKFNKIPEKPSDVIVNTRGAISLFDRKTKKMTKIGTLGIVDQNGVGIVNPQIQQGYTEASNVALQNEFMSLMPIKRNFEANRQMFLIGNSTLQKAISQLGQA
ncbi:MAG: flagellar basal body rod C-terminal domain-containing protein [Candidatus Gastranaerophilaceae bacterium]